MDVFEIKYAKIPDDAALNDPNLSSEETEDSTQSMFSDASSESSSESGSEDSDEEKEGKLTALQGEVFVSSDVKRRLLQNLKIIKTTNYALQFCSLLIKAQGMLEYWPQKKKLRPTYPDSPSKDEGIFNRVKEILNLEPASELVKIFLKVLNAPPKECQEKQQFLTAILKSECDKFKYLNQLIVFAESLVTDFRYPDLKPEIYEKNLLVLLQEFTFNYGRRITERLFYDMFRLGVYKYEFSWEEKKEIGDIVIEGMPSIEKLIKSLCCGECAEGHACLRLRSSLQFIRDLLADCSAEQDILKEIVGKLDEVMKTQDICAVWSDYADLYDPNDDYSRLSDEDISDELRELLEDFDKAGARLVPKEHFWWQLYRKAYYL